VEANEYTRSFLVGRRLGTLFGLCAQLREVDFDTDYRPKYHISETDFAVRVGEVAKELCAMPEMAGCTYAGLLLQRLAVNRVSRLDLDGPPEVSLWAGEIAPAGGDAEDDEAGPLERLVDCCEPGRRYAVLIDHIRQVAGVALGELLGTLKDADVEVQEKDIRSATPRMFPLSRDAPAERVRGQVYLIERELNDRTASGMLPENAVAMLGAAPEALAKQLWPDTFAAAGPRDGVMQILAEKARLSSDENTRKFAQNALHLYKTYRNPAVHNLATYECSWEEARFFLNGIRVLLDLHDRIKAANDLSSPP
jgi:hypothetical protein